MKNSKRFLERMNELDDDVLKQAENCSKRRGSFFKIGVIAAVVALIAVIAILIAIPSIKKAFENNDNGEEDLDQVLITEVYWVDTRKRNDSGYLTEQGTIEWPWNCRDVYNQYTEITLNGEMYRARSSYYGGEVYANKIGKKLLNTDCTGFDLSKDEKHSIKCEVFEILGVDSERIVAVRYDGYDGYYAFIKEAYQAPNTLGELIDSLDLTNNVKLNSFYYDEKADGNDVEEHYALSDKKSAELWNIVKKYADAPKASQELFSGTKERIGFAINSSTLGVYNLSFAFNSDGYLTTNIENYGYVYNVGKEAYGEILEFALKNKQLVIIPEKQYLVGTVTEIGEDYIKVDDSIFMKDPDDGIEFTVYATNMNIRRYIISGYLKVGDTVCVEHSFLPKAHYTEIKNARDLDKCVITTEGDIVIPE